jgi:spermidine/putrescine transport system permease protein
MVGCKIVQRAGDMTRAPLILSLYAVASVAFLYLPAIAIILFSFNDSIYVAFPIKSLTFDWYVALWDNRGMQNALKNSLIVALGVATSSTIIGTLGAYGLIRHRIRGQSLILGAALLPMVIPSIIMGVSLLIVFRGIGLPLSLWAVALGHLVVCLPFAVIVMMSRFSGQDGSLEDASRDLGEGGVSTFLRITLPLAFPGVLACFLMTFTISLDEFMVSFFLSSNETTLPVYIWSQLRFPKQLPLVLALGTLMLVLSFGIMLSAEWLRRKGTNSTSTEE